jgi:hypothetical protein
VFRIDIFDLIRTTLYSIVVVVNKLNDDETLPIKAKSYVQMIFCKNRSEEVLL